MSMQQEGHVVTRLAVPSCSNQRAPAPLTATPAPSPLPQLWLRPLPPAAAAALPPLRAAAPACQRADDLLLGCAALDLSALADLGRLDGWYHVVDHYRRAVGQMKLEVGAKQAVCCLKVRIAAVWQGEVHTHQFPSGSFGTEPICVSRELCVRKSMTSPCRLTPAQLTPAPPAVEHPGLATPKRPQLASPSTSRAAAVATPPRPSPGGQWSGAAAASPRPQLSPDAAAAAAGWHAAEARRSQDSGRAAGQVSSEALVEALRSNLQVTAAQVLPAYVGALTLQLA